MGLGIVVGVDVASYDHNGIPLKDLGADERVSEVIRAVHQTAGCFNSPNGALAANMGPGISVLRANESFPGEWFDLPTSTQAPASGPRVVRLARQPVEERVGYEYVPTPLKVAAIEIYEKELVLDVGE